ncbi:UNVERIFIED_CONTAM: hypothetical protein HHA_312190 [Hammondia hammondi]|eukprot:XP_008885806.1 hypothetical protein HHA_312190 [Hammondia hammondi]
MALRRRPSSARKSDSSRNREDSFEREESPEPPASPRRSAAQRSSSAAKERGRPSPRRATEDIPSAPRDTKAAKKVAKTAEKEGRTAHTSPRLARAGSASRRGVHTADGGRRQSSRGSISGDSPKSRRQPLHSSSDENYDEDSAESEKEEENSEEERGETKRGRAKMKATSEESRCRRRIEAVSTGKNDSSSLLAPSRDRLPPPYRPQSVASCDGNEKHNPSSLSSSSSSRRGGSQSKGKCEDKRTGRASVSRASPSPAASRKSKENACGSAANVAKSASRHVNSATSLSFPEASPSRLAGTGVSSTLPVSPSSSSSSLASFAPVQRPDCLLPSWVRHFLTVYSRFATRELSLSAALASVRGILREAADFALAHESGEETERNSDKGDGETRRPESGDGGGESEERKGKGGEGIETLEREGSFWREEMGVTAERLLEVVFRQSVHLCLTLPKLPEREGGRLCAFFYRTLAKLDELVAESRRNRLTRGSETSRHRAPKTDEAREGNATAEGEEAEGLRGQERTGETGLEDADMREETEAGEDVEKNTRNADKGLLRYRYVEALWCRLLPQLLCRSRAARVGVCCFLLQLVGWGCGMGIEVAESIQQTHREILLQLLGKSKEAAVRRMALLLLEHFQTPSPACVVWRAFMGHLTDEAPAVRRAAVCRILLLPLPSRSSPESMHAPETLEFAAAVSQLLTRRASDASADVRAAVYRRLAHNDASMSVEQKSALVLMGLNDKAKGVREACSRMLRRWVQGRQSASAEPVQRAGEAPDCAASPKEKGDGGFRSAGEGGDVQAAQAWAGRTKREEDGCEANVEGRDTDGSEVAAFTAFCDSPLHRLVDELMENMPSNETAIEVLVKEVFLRSPQDARLDLLRKIQKKGKNLSKLTAAGLLILRVYMQTLASPEDRANLDVPDLHQLLLQLLAACKHREEEQKKEAVTQAKTLDCTDTAASAQIEALLQGAEDHLLTLNVCLRQLLLLACFVDIAEQQQARLLDEACEKILLKVPLIDCARLLTSNIDPLETRVTPLSPAFGGDSGSVQTSGFLTSSIGHALWPGYWVRCSALAACVQLLRRLQRVLLAGGGADASLVGVEASARDADGRGAHGRNQLVRMQQHENAFSERICTLIAEIREPLDVSCEDASVVTTMWQDTDEVDPLSVPVREYAMLTLQQQHSALLDELAGLQQKSRGLFEVAGSFRDSSGRSSAARGPSGKKRRDGEEGGEQMAHAVQQQITRTQKQFQRTAELALVLNDELHARWFRVSCILDAFFARSSSNGSVDPALSDIPSSILLPALEFYCNEADAFAFCVSSCCCKACCAASATPASLSGDKQSGEEADRRRRVGDEENPEDEKSMQCWRNRDQRLQEAALGIRSRAPLHSDLCEVLVTKSLGCFCLLSTRQQEVAKQLKAYHVSLLASLGELQSTSLYLQQSLSHQQTLVVAAREADECVERRERRLLLLLREDEEQRGEDAVRERQEVKRAKQRGKSREERERELGDARQAVDEASRTSEQVADECRKVAAQIQEAESAFTSHMLRCELYVCFLGDLLLSHPTLLQCEASKQSVLLPPAEDASASSSLLDLLWHIATGEEASTKQLQSMALAVLLKLLVLPLAEDREEREQASGSRQPEETKEPEKKGTDATLTQLQRVVADRLRVLLEVVYLQPTLESGSREVMNYVHSASVWGYSADTKFLCFTILQCFASPLLPPGAARTAFGAFFGACRHLATHGLRGVLSLHFTLHQESEKRDKSLSSSSSSSSSFAALASADDEALEAFVEDHVKSCASVGWSETQALPPLLKMTRDLKKLLLFAFRGVRSMCVAFALASLSRAGKARRAGAEKKAAADLRFEGSENASANERAPNGSRGDERDKGSPSEEKETRGEREETNAAKEYVTRYLELLIVFLLVADEYVRPLLLLQSNLRFFDLVALAVSGWVDGSEAERPQGDRQPEEKEKGDKNSFRSLVDIHVACDAQGCLTLLLVVHHLLRDLVETVRASAPVSGQPSAVATRRLTVKVLSEALKKLKSTLFSLLSRHGDGELSVFLRDAQEEEQPDAEAQRDARGIQKTVDHLLQRKSCAELAQRMRESHRYTVQEQIAAENAVFASPLLTFPFASLDAQQTALNFQAALQQRQARVEERARRLAEGDACESSEEDIESPPPRRRTAPRKCKQEALRSQGSPRSGERRQDDSEFESCESSEEEGDDDREASNSDDDAGRGQSTSRDRHKDLAKSQ